MAITESFTLRRDLLGHVNEDAMVPTEFVAEQLSPTVLVEQTSASMAVLERGETIKAADSTQRNTDGTSNQGTFSMGEDSYTTEHFIWEQVIDRIQLKISAQYYDSQVISAMIADMVLKIGREQRIAASYQNNAGFTAVDAGSVIAAGNAWTDQANATPWDNVEAMSEQAFDVAGIRKENMTLVMDRQVLSEVLRTDELVQNAKFTSNMEQLTVDVQKSYLKTYLGVEDIIVRSGTYNTAGINGVPAFDTIWDNSKIQLVKKPLSSGFAFGGFSRQPSYSGLFGGKTMMSSYVKESHQQLIIRAEEYRGVKNDYKWGILLTGVA